MRAAGFLVAVVATAACQPMVERDREGLMSPPGPYDYPLANPVAATVVGTPAQDKVKLPREIPIEQHHLTIFEDRAIPEVFWYEDTFRYSLAPQPDRAPLIFLVGGTNAGYNSRLSVFLQQAFYLAGFHVVSLSSPTYPNFMVTASTTGVPGRTSQDSADLYRAMQRVLRQVSRRIDVADVYLAGYSLGGWQSAFVAARDRDEQAIGLRKVLLINPPVSLYRSSAVLDRLLVDNLPGGIDNLDAFIDQVLAKLAPAYEGSQADPLDQDFLYRAYTEARPSERELAALIGVAFRLSSANIAFTADVLSKSGYIVPPGRTLSQSTSLTPYFDASMRRGFEDYFENLLYPYYRARDPALTQQEMIAEASLEHIGDFLANAENVGVVTNADDIILAPGDLDFLRRVFGPRATIFPNGGHCGNMNDRHVFAAMLRFLAE